MGMNANIVKSVLEKLLVCATLSMVSMSNAFAAGRLSYYESKGGVVKFSLELSDDRVDIVKLVKLRDGSLHLPKLYYYQGHKTPIGFRKVEKEGGLSIAAGKKFSGIILPVAEDIEKYMLLVRTAYPVDSVKDGQAVKEWKFTDWIFVEVAAQDVAKDTPIPIPSVKTLSKRNAEQDVLFQELMELYNAALKEEQERQRQPVINRTKVPWYAR